MYLSTSLARYMVFFAFTLQLMPAHDSLTLSTHVHKLSQIKLHLFMLNRRPIFALLHFRLIRSKYGRWYGPPVRTSPYFCTNSQTSQMVDPYMNWVALSLHRPYRPNLRDALSLHHHPILSKWCLSPSWT